MSNLNVVEANLPPGFRFHPRDEELVCDYLMKKLTRSEQPPILMDVDLNKSEPWDIPDSTCVGGKDWYFYSQRDRKYATGLRTNRATVSGYWKATGKDRPVSRRSTLVGMRKTLVFYQGRAPKGKKTDWVMHEFRLEGPLGPPKLSSSKEDWVLCRVFYKNKEVAAAKQGPSMGIGDDTSSSSTLPPLMDPYITFDQTHDQYEQVPCFSIFTPNQTTSSQSKHTQELQPNILAGSPAFGGINVGSSNTNNTLTCAYTNNPCSSSCEDTMVIDAILNHLTKMDDSHINPTNMTTMMIKDSPCSFGEGSSESLSDVAFPTIWNHY